MTHQRRTSRLTKDGQSSSSIGSTLTWWLISSGACIRASLKILRLPLLFSRQLSSTAPTAVTVLLSSDRRRPDNGPRRYRLRPPRCSSAFECRFIPTTITVAECLAVQEAPGPQVCQRSPAPLPL